MRRQWFGVVRRSVEHPTTVIASRVALRRFELMGEVELVDCPREVERCPRCAHDTAYCLRQLAGRIPAVKDLARERGEARR